MSRKRPSLKSGAIVLILSFILTCYPAAGEAAVGDDLSPSVPGSLAVANKTHTSVALSWNPSKDNVGVKGYQVYRDGKKIITTSKNSYTNADLIPGRKYTYTIKAYDAAGNLSGYSEALAVTTLYDTEAPTAPKNLAVSSTTMNSITLTWGPSSDNIGVKSYEVYRNGKKITSTSATSYTNKSLASGQVYQYYVKAYDTAGNYSAASNTVSASTDADRSAPTVPSGVRTLSSAQTEISLAWNASTDNVKVSKYEIYRDGTKLGTTTKTTYSSKNLSPGKSYTYTVKAVDAAGNVSAASNPLNAATVRDTNIPTAPGKLKAGSVSGSTVPLSWSASKDDTKVAGYYIYCNGVNIASTAKTSLKVKGNSIFGISLYHVKAYDMAGNLSANSNTVFVFNP